MAALFILFEEIKREEIVRYRYLMWGSYVPKKFLFFVI